MSHIRCLVSIGVAFGLMGLAASGATAQYYKGKTITMLYGYSPGGAIGTQTSLLAQILSKHIPGSPDVVAKSMPGAGGLKAQNWLYERGPKDGLTLIYTPTASQSQLLGQKGVRFDYGKFTVIGALNTTPMMTYVRKDAVPGGLKQPADIVKADNLKQAGLRATAWYDLQTRLSLDLLGVTYRYVPGYRGGAKVAAAVRSGEAQVAGAPFINYVVRLKSSMGGPNGVIAPLWYWPFSNSDGTPISDPIAEAENIPMFRDVYKQVHGKAPSGQHWEALRLLVALRGAVTNVFFGPPGMDPAAVEAFRAGFQRMVKDPEFGPTVKKVLGSELVPVPVEQAEKAFKAVANTDPKLVRFLREYAFAGGK